MASVQTVSAAQITLEDPLADLPCSSIVEHKKRQFIYRQDQPSASIYLVSEGNVKVARLASDGRQTIDLYQPTISSVNPRCWVCHVGRNRPPLWSLLR